MERARGSEPALVQSVKPSGCGPCRRRFRYCLFDADEQPVSREFKAPA